MNLHVTLSYSTKLLQNTPKIKLKARWLKTVKFNQTKAMMHVTTPKYPPAKTIPLPDNLKGISGAEIGCFSPLRNRDYTGPAILCHASNSLDQNQLNVREFESYDPHVESYDCMGTVNLNSAMQTNVPIPFSSKGKSTHLNMPGGQWQQNYKFLADDMHSTHYLNTKRYMSQQTANTKELSRKDKLKIAITQYGSTVIVFHVGISLISLGGCYLAVSSGLDVVSLISSLGFENKVLSNKFAANTGTFVAAYAIHKLFAPVRISITLASTPFIVKYLRKIGILKPPKVIGG